MLMRQRSRIKTVFMLCPVRWALSAASGIVIAFHLLLRNNAALMNALCRKVVVPLHRAMAILCSKLEFSAAELLIGVSAVLMTGYLLYQLVALILKPNRLERLFRTVMSVISAAGTVYAAFCLLWGVYYYGTDFIGNSGLSCEAVSVEQLRTVTEYFAGKANYYSEMVTRDDKGLYTADRSELLRRSEGIFDNIENVIPSLKGPRVRAKGIRFSKIMSYTDFTGFFFPFTGEANVNTDFPVSLFAATVAHELAHQRGVPREQDANFAAVAASLESGDIDYCYSASLLAYIYLGNALSEADRSSWQQVYSGMSDNVKADLNENTLYWQAYRTPVREVSNRVYEGFLQSYDQQLGLKSYGACVDLLVNYYYAAAAAK